MLIRDLSIGVPVHAIQKDSVIDRQKGDLIIFQRTGKKGLR